ncbi:hypothetical protein CBR_g55454 [Chara braunii]|uniref:Uncharacterized protein n=1 Tax=Chara braunii TaxID=69332 RepID=A0A388K7V0_CHABU|nr:hypothetical protein CBR_g55454 [Chara braunii]|eukprot:GBG66111.1 hypothetical protein CBR_g55454 [Chara braunii]
MSCGEIAQGQRSDCRFILAKVKLLKGNMVSTVGYVGATSLSRLFSLVCLIPLDLYLYRALPDLRGYPNYHLQRGPQRLHEALVLLCIVVILDAALTWALIFFSPMYSTCSSLFCLMDGDRASPSWERVDRAQRETDMGLAWYVHLKRHWYLTPMEAQADIDLCGLPGYWFYSIKDLLNMALQRSQGGEDDFELSGGLRKLGQGSARSLLIQRRETRAMKTLQGLSGPIKPCTCDLFDEEGSIDGHMQDIAQVSRCTHDVDAGWDFLVSGGYLAMLQIVRSCPAESNDVQLAASICGGFASSLSVLPWQPTQRRRDTLNALNILKDDDFGYCIADLLRSFIHVLEWQVGKQTPDLSQAEAAMFAISSFANAASDMHAHYHALSVLDECSSRLTCRLGGNSVNMFMNAFTTLCPLGWPLRCGIPDFSKAKGWIDGVLTVLSEPKTVETLLRTIATFSDQSVASKVVAHAIRALWAMWSCRAIYWHRFDKRMPQDFPPPAALINKLSNEDKVTGILKALVRQCNESQWTSILSPFSKLHLAKILICQKVRDIDPEVATILLQCLCYWRHTLGSRELDWFASEVIETLHDLIDSSEDAVTIAKLIRDSPGGLSCLLLMLNSHVSRIRAVRLAENKDDASTCRLPYGPFNTPGRCLEGSEIHYCRCNAAATALLYRLLVSNHPATTLPPPEDNPDLFVDMIKALSWIVLSLMRQVEDKDDENDLDGGDRYGYGLGYSHSHRVEGKLNRHRRGCWTCRWWSRARRGLSHLKSDITLKSTLLCLESLDNPAWRPPFGFCEGMSCPLEDSSEDRMENFETSVNFLLAARQSLRIISVLVKNYPQLQKYKYVQWYFSTLVRCLIGGCPRMSRQLGLSALEGQCHSEMREVVATTLARTVRAVNELVEDNPSPLPAEPPSPIYQALTHLKTWADSMAAKDKLQKALDLQGTAVSGGASHAENSAIDSLLMEMKSLALPCSIQST